MNSIWTHRLRACAVDGVDWHVIRCVWHNDLEACGASQQITVSCANGKDLIQIDSKVARQSL